VRYSDLCIAGWSSLVARRAHNPKVASSNLAPATREVAGQSRSERIGLSCAVGIVVTNWSQQVNRALVNRAL
jgi:hypothetical protein